MVISHVLLEIKRRARGGCIESMLDLVNCYGEGNHGIAQDDKLYLKHALKLLDHIDEIRESHFSSSHVYYEILYAYLEQGNDALAGYYLDRLLWELLYDYADRDLEAVIEELKIRELAEYLGLDLEEDIEKLKEGQKLITLEGYKVMDVNDFFTNS